ncbi:MAG: hypothetical protein HN754_10850 [Opitutae bacterium]|nr:hypothetical protein [Opitutae bacterium]
MMRVLTSGTGFVCLLLGALFLALCNPGLGAKGSHLNPEYFSEILVVFIFLIQGMRIKITSLSVILRKPVGSLALQIGLVFLPILGLEVAWFCGLVSEELYGPLFFAAILPTTITSCVVYTGNVQGNGDYALGHATFSNLIAPFSVPILWASSDSLSLSSYLQIFNIISLVILPCFLGWLSVRIFPRVRSLMRADWLSGLPMFAIVILVYHSLCDGISILGYPLFIKEVWRVFPASLLFVLLIHLSGWLVAGRWSKSRDIHVAQFFCLSQKSLATGIPLASILFAGLGDDLLRMTMPLFCIHFLQLILGAALFQPVRKWVVGEDMTK